MFKQISALTMAVSLGVATGANLPKNDVSDPRAHAMDIRRTDLPNGPKFTEVVYGSVVRNGSRVDINGAPCELSPTDQALIDSVMLNGAKACVAARGSK